jgi:hypothetical protein
MKKIEYCTHTDCIAHPQNPNSSPAQRIILRVEDTDIEVEISFPCLICDKAKKVDMKEALKKAFVKNNLKDSKASTSI